MAFTYTTVTKDYDNPVGGQPDGYVTFIPTEPMVNGGVTVVAAAIRADLDTAGAITVSLAANTDPATTPTGVRYLVTERVVGQASRSYLVTIPHDRSPVDLGELED